MKTFKLFLLGSLFGVSMTANCMEAVRAALEKAKKEEEQRKAESENQLVVFDGASADLDELIASSHGMSDRALALGREAESALTQRLDADAELENTLLRNISAERARGGRSMELALSSKERADKATAEVERLSGVVRELTAMIERLRLVATGQSEQ